jgi:carbamoyl-phosphate synthase large subunit
MKKKLESVIILGSSALKIGEAGEFDYSGSQAIKALQEEKVRTILINPNIATIQTSESLADEVYFLPVTPEFVTKVIEKERPNGILLGFGGQTALNCGLALEASGILKKYETEILGTSADTIRKTEDRALFNAALEEIDVKYPVSKAVQSIEEATAFAEDMGYPVMLRIAYALGGLGSGICYNKSQLVKKAKQALSYASQFLVEEYLEGWKEIEYEVVRDAADNCITVCNMENVDPLGIHTGESIVVAPSQTLTNEEYHSLRSIAIKTIRHLNIVGECNIQYALNPKNSDYRVIEVNARLSRSSALASKATGYPLAFIAAKLALGYLLPELKNAITQTSAFFEPALDYIVVKMPRWDLKKFRNVNRQIGSSMKSVGEVMAIGRSFEEALQKAVRMLGSGAIGLIGNRQYHFDNLEESLSAPSDERLFAVVEAFQNGYSVELIHKLTHIDPWFLQKLMNIVAAGADISENGLNFSQNRLREIKALGFSDEQLSILSQKPVEDIRKYREEHQIFPAIKQIDTVAAEYPASTNYLYLTYGGVADDVNVHRPNGVIILGSGPYRIGSSVEFDWCAVSGGQTLKAMNRPAIMINCNPETVSTDYDEFEILFFEELTLESISEIYRKTQAQGVTIAFGGQTPNNLALPLHQAGIPILGTSPKSIDRAEDRSKFSAMLDSLNIAQPAWKALSTVEEALSFAGNVGYPVLVRPSYVLSGAAMAVASNDVELIRFLQKAVELSPVHPVVISKFLENAKELEFDAVARDGEILIYAISDHVENAGVHSGDATLVLPPQRVYFETVRQIRQNSTEIAKALNINGPFNIQYIAENNRVKVIECNLRASRSFPFVSKTLNHNFIEIATRVIVGEKIQRIPLHIYDYDYVAVKAPEFSFTRLEGADPATGVEMSSTGEVACFGKTFNEAFLKALISVGYRFPLKTVLISSGAIESKAELLQSCRTLLKLGISFYATGGTHRFLEQNQVPSQLLHWPLENRHPNVLDFLKNQRVDLVINIPKNYNTDELANDYLIRRTAVDYKIPLITNRQLAMRLAEALDDVNISDIAIKSYKEYRANLKGDI